MARGRVEEVGRFESEDQSWHSAERLPRVKRCRLQSKEKKTEQLMSKSFVVIYSFIIVLIDLTLSRLSFGLKMLLRLKKQQRLQ